MGTYYDKKKRIGITNFLFKKTESGRLIKVEDSKQRKMQKRKKELEG